MKIYFLRHEHRGKGEVLFRSELNTEGKYMANSLLKNYLNFLKIDEIYCSPFIRALQTISPFVHEYQPNNRIKVDYAIAEYIEHDRFKEEKNRIFKLNDIDYGIYKIDTNYKWLLDEKCLKYPDSCNDLMKRCSLFAENIKKRYQNTEKTLLICSHKSTINMLIKCFHDANRKITDDYDMGKVAIYENNKLLMLN
tara:strand:- start:52 stop:636 length:585 start_codon:yes stop_codon:yes gene_type:complete